MCCPEHITYACKCCSAETKWNLKLLFKAHWVKIILKVLLFAQRIEKNPHSGAPNYWNESRIFWSLLVYAGKLSSYLRIFLTQQYVVKENILCLMLWPSVYIGGRKGCVRRLVHAWVNRRMCISSCITDVGIFVVRLVNIWPRHEV